MAVQAYSKGVRISPRKVSPVAALVRGRSVEDALVILEHTPRRAAQAVKKTVLSAKSNAEHDHNYRPGSLYIAQILITAGPRFRRYRAAARGRALRFERKTSHIKVIVDGDKRQSKANSDKTAKAKPKTPVKGES